MELGSANSDAVLGSELLFRYTRYPTARGTEFQFSATAVVDEPSEADRELGVSGITSARDPLSALEGGDSPPELYELTK